VPLRLHPAQGNPIEIDADRTLIGRDKTAEIRLTESSVSRKHATIERRGPQWIITDGGSANGTFLDDVQVAESPLRDGQTLRLGAVSFKVEVEEEPTPTQTLRPSDLEAKTQPAVPAYRPPPPAAAPAAPAMTPAQAAEMLGIAAGTPPAEVRRQYQKLHNDLQVRMTNTPSPSLKRMYQKNLQELKLACEVLAPGSSS
jgi:pSer/pThr/pTyr-binding forkhead associated (FHA) protein